MCRPTAQNRARLVLRELRAKSGNPAHDMRALFGRKWRKLQTGIASIKSYDNHIGEGWLGPGIMAIRSCGSLAVQPPGLEETESGTLHKLGDRGVSNKWATGFPQN